MQLVSITRKTAVNSPPIKKCSICCYSPVRWVNIHLGWVTSAGVIGRNPVGRKLKVHQAIHRLHEHHITIEKDDALHGMEIHRLRQYMYQISCLKSNMKKKKATKKRATQGQQAVWNTPNTLPLLSFLRHPFHLVTKQRTSTDLELNQLKDPELAPGIAESIH